MRLTLDNLAMYCHDCGDCLRWAQGLNSTGYPQANIGGKPVMVRRYVFTELLKKQIPQGCCVTARCGDKTCVAPEHLVAMKRGSVLVLAYAQGKRMHAAEYGARLRQMQRTGRTSLDWAKVNEIRSRPASTTHAALAAEFGVSPRCISDARRGVSWRMQMPASSVFALGAAA